MPKNIIEIDCGEEAPKKCHKGRSHVPRPYTYSLPTNEIAPIRRMPSPPPLVPTVVGHLPHSPHIPSENRYSNENSSADSMAPPPPTIKDESKTSEVVPAADSTVDSGKTVRDNDSGNSSSELTDRALHADTSTNSISSSIEKREGNSPMKPSDDDYIDEGRLTIDDSV